jgi:hypothetical protein
LVDIDGIDYINGRAGVVSATPAAQVYEFQNGILLYHNDGRAAQAGSGQDEADPSVIYWSDDLGASWNQAAMPAGKTSCTSIKWSRRGYWVLQSGTAWYTARTLGTWTQTTSNIGASGAFGVTSESIYRSSISVCNRQAGYAVSASTPGWNASTLGSASVLAGDCGAAAWDA